MPKAHSPRHGSMQYWPRKRAKGVLSRIRTWTTSKDVKPLGFVGYKVGMCHCIGSTALTKGMAFPVTLVECPAIKIFSARLYKKNVLKTEILCPKPDKELERSVVLPNNYSKVLEDGDFDSVRILAYTQPSKTGIGKKKPEVFEVGLGGIKEDQIKWVKENFEKEINVRDIFRENSIIDIHAITKGKGYQGVVKRFGVSLKHHKSEKGVRRVGSRAGGWCAQAHMMYRVPQPGKMGYHNRTEHNKLIVKIDDKCEKSFHRYGFIKNSYLMIYGSLPGPAKRAIKMTFPIRPNKFDKVKVEKVIL